jgi:hypothetical protein
LNDSQILQRIEETVERYLRHDVLKEAGEAIDASVAAHNAEVAAANEATEAAGRQLDHERAGVDEIAAEVSRLDMALAVRPGLEAAPEVTDAFNAKVKERNALAARHGEAVDGLNAAVRLFNAGQRDEQAAGEQRRRILDEGIRTHEEACEAYVEWRKRDGSKRLWDELNEVFARVRPRAVTGVEPPELAKARALRREIAEFAIAARQKSQSGWLSVEARLGDEAVWLDVDTGASVVGISPEIVEALNWSVHVGEKVELLLVGGLRLEAPQLGVPELSVHGQSADHVKGAVINDPGFGRDGSLGLSFLTRFHYSISGGDAPPCLTLSPKSSTPEREYDVFVCHKSEDEESARIVFDYLRAEGYRPFFSPVSLGVKSTAFQQAIDRALEDAPHMIVVGSSGANMEAPWVRSEWQRYLVLCHTFRKTGSLIVLLCGEMRADQLPVGLVDCQAFGIRTEDWRAAILRCLAR